MSEPCKPCPPFLVITTQVSGDTNAYYVYMKNHPDPEKNGVYIVDLENKLNHNVLQQFKDLNDNKEYVLTENTVQHRVGGRRRSQKRPTASRSSKVRKARATRRK